MSSSSISTLSPDSWSLSNDSVYIRLPAFFEQVRDVNMNNIKPMMQFIANNAQFTVKQFSQYYNLYYDTQSRGNFVDVLRNYIIDGSIEWRQSTTNSNNNMASSSSTELLYTRTDSFRMKHDANPAFTFLCALDVHARFTASEWDAAVNQSGSRFCKELQYYIYLDWIQLFDHTSNNNMSSSSSSTPTTTSPDDVFVRQPSFVATNPNTVIQFIATHERFTRAEFQQAYDSGGVSVLGADYLLTFYTRQGWITLEEQTPPPPAKKQKISGGATTTTMVQSLDPTDGNDDDDLLAHMVKKFPVLFTHFTEPGDGGKVCIKCGEHEQELHVPRFAVEHCDFFETAMRNTKSNTVLIPEYSRSVLFTIIWDCVYRPFNTPANSLEKEVYSCMVAFEQTRNLLLSYHFIRMYTNYFHCSTDHQHFYPHAGGYDLLISNALKSIHLDELSCEQITLMLNEHRTTIFTRLQDLIKSSDFKQIPTAWVADVRQCDWILYALQTHKPLLLSSLFSS